MRGDSDYEPRFHSMGARLALSRRDFAPIVRKAWSRTVMAEGLCLSVRVIWMAEIQYRCSCSCLRCGAAVPRCLDGLPSSFVRPVGVGCFEECHDMEGERDGAVWIQSIRAALMRGSYRMVVSGLRSGVEAGIGTG
jgi:hypothetical protein